MRWEDERYVRVYTRDTVDWMNLGWEAQALFLLVIRRVDRTGILELGRSGARGLAAHLRMPSEVVERVLPLLVDDGCIELVGPNLIVKNFVEAQEARMSPNVRQQESRLRRRDLMRLGLDPSQRDTVIYFIQSENGGPIKIGRADDLAKRLVGLQTSRPDKLVVLAAAQGTPEQERKLHARFAAIREKGEWFSATDELLTYVKRVASTLSFDELEVTSRDQSHERDASQSVTGHSVPSVPNQPSTTPPSPAASVDPEPAPTQPAAPSRRGSRLPDGWVPTVGTADTVIAELGLETDFVRHTLSEFADYWRAVPGSKGTKLDWDATWRNWLRTAASRRRPMFGTQRHESNGRPASTVAQSASHTPEQEARLLAAQAARRKADEARQHKENGR